MGIDERDSSPELGAAMAHIIEDVLAHYPATQGIYLFGSFATADERANSDIDIALLLPPDEANRAGLS